MRTTQPIVASLHRKGTRTEGFATLNTPSKTVHESHSQSHIPYMLRYMLNDLRARLQVEGVVLIVHLPSVTLSPSVFTAGDTRLSVPEEELRELVHTQLGELSDNERPHPLPWEVQKALTTQASHVIVTPVGLPGIHRGLILLLVHPDYTLDADARQTLEMYTHILAHVFADVQVRHDMSTLLAATRDLAEGDDLDAVLHRLLYHATELTDTEAASILLQDMRTGKLIFRAAIGPNPAPLRNVQVPLNSIAGRTLRENRPLVIHNVREESEHFREVDETTGFQTQSLMAVPIHWRGQVIGVVEVLNKREGTFNDHDLEMLQALANHAAAIIQHARLAEERERALEELRRLDERKTQFIHLVSHELRTPLTIIRGYAEMLAEELGNLSCRDCSAALQNADYLLNEILAGAKRLSTIVEEITRAAHTPHPSENNAIEPVVIQDAVLFALSEVASWAEVKTIRMDVHLPEAPITINANREMLQEAILQVVNNAVKFTPEGGRVQVSAWKEDGHVYIQVRDTGPGIPEEEQERIFEPFYQVESPLTRRHPGLGLGLTIVKQAVEEHGGQVWVESAPGKGSTFTLVFSSEL